MTTRLAKPGLTFPHIVMDAEITLNTYHKTILSNLCHSASIKAVN